MKKVYLLLASVLLLSSAQFAAAQGTTDYVPLWTSSTTLGNSKIYQTGGNVGVGTTSPQWALDVSGHINAGSGYRLGEQLFLWAPGGNGTANTAVGASAGGSAAGGDNTAVGASAMTSSTSEGAYSNTAVGVLTLFEVEGSLNTAVGAGALENLLGGSSNTALGFFAGDYYSSGSGNIAIGDYAANNVSGANSNNIHIGSQGASGDNATIRIGTSGTQTSFFAAGVRGVTTGENNAVPVVIDSNGQLGTVSSSRRFKEDIQDMGSATEGLMRLRPVTFRYQKPFADGSKPIQYGLIAEEVAEVYPELVAHSADGQIESVKYQLLDSMLLNEIQRQQSEIQRQNSEMQRQQSDIQSLREKLAKLEALLTSLSAKQ